MNPPPPIKTLGAIEAVLRAIGAVVSFTLAYAFSACSFLMVVFLACMFRLCWLPTPRRAYYFGLVIGLAVYTPHLLFFRVTFGWGVIGLWYVLPFWLGLFLMVGHACLFRFGAVAWACLAPFVWTGFEFFRSELYYLRFSWLNPGCAFSNSGALHYLAAYGVYGIAFLFMAAAGVISLRGLARRIGGACLIGALLYPNIVSTPASSSPKTLRVTGIQMEFPGAATAKSALDDAMAKFPETDVFVLSEYTFTGPIPDSIKAWCRKHRKHLVAGGEDLAPQNNFYDTAFVVDTNGEIAFRQAKCVPVQFMKDGLPARQQQLWNSPWGKIGLGICYDLSYTRVTDELIRQGAQALVFPTMDMEDWGAAQHWLHARIAPMRAAEYGIPVFRVCSSGISQFVDATGRVRASAPFPGGEAMLSAEIELPDHGRLPPDRLLARLSVAATAILAAWLALEALLQKTNQPRSQPKSA